MNNIKGFTKTLTQIAMAVLLVMAIPAAQAAKGGGGKVSVTAALPGEALQGEELDVIVSGSGFDEGTTTKYLVTGTNDDTQIEVISTEFVDPNQLKTRIRVKGGATIIDYDIQATNSRGRRGKGTTLFSVKQSSGGGNGGGNTNLGDDYTATDGVEFISLSDDEAFDYYIIGTQGNDEIYAGSGADLIEGGDGQDQIFARGGDDEIHAGADGGFPGIEAGSGNDLIFGGAGGDTIIGDEGNDRIFAGAGNDRLQGGAGTDWLEGGDGHDMLYFSLGSFDDFLGQYEVDYYNGNLGHDFLFFTNFQGHFRNYQEVAETESVFVDMTTTPHIYQVTVKDPSGTLVTVNGEFFNISGVWGTDGDDVLHGDDADNLLNGGDGDNIIYGYGGNDQLGVNGWGNNVFYGGSGNDYISASSGNNILFGEAGDDLLRADGGEDELHGGEGCDGFIFSTAFGTQTIMDFDYPYDEEACDLIYIAIHSSYRVDFSNVKINSDGPNDIIIDVEVKRGGRWAGTIILKDALLNGVTVDESTFIFPGTNYLDVDCSLYWCAPF